MVAGGRRYLPAAGVAGGAVLVLALCLTALPMATAVRYDEGTMTRCMTCIILKVDIVESSLVEEEPCIVSSYSDSVMNLLDSNNCNTKFLASSTVMRCCYVNGFLPLA